MADSEFDKLMADFDKVLAKSTAAAEQLEDDKKIEAAAEGADKDDPKGDGKTEDAEGEAFGKSFAVTLDSGEQAEAYDGTEMLKALHAANKALRDADKALGEQVSAIAAGQVGQAKVNGRVVDLLKSLQSQIEAQGELIKSLREAPGGRKAVLVDPKPQVEEPEKLSRGEILAKSMSAYQAGKISAHEAARIETVLNLGGAVPAELLTRLAS